MNDTLVDAAEMARRLGVARSTVYAWTSRGLLPHVRAGRSIRFDAREVLTYLSVTGRPSI